MDVQTSYNSNSSAHVDSYNLRVAGSSQRSNSLSLIGECVQIYIFFFFCMCDLCERIMSMKSFHTQQFQKDCQTSMSKCQISLDFCNTVFKLLRAF